MSEYYHNDNESGSIPVSFFRTYGTLRPIERSLSLLSELETFGSDVREWTSSKTSERIITFKAGTLIEETHDFLSDHGVCVFPKKTLGKDAILSMPHGSKSMRTIAGFIERDPEHYSVIFQLLGSQLRAIHDSGTGLPSGDWLNQFAYYPDPSETYGAKVVFLPPYNTHFSDKSAMAEIGQRLADTTHLNETTITQLAWEVQDGWNRES